MTFQIKMRGSTDRPIAAEYLCPVHGRFMLDVQRDANGDPPAEMPCPKPSDNAFRPPGAAPGCAYWSPYAISAPRVRVRLVEAVRGKYQRAELPTWTDTTNLGEGQDLDDWRADREKVWDEHRRRENKELLR